MSNKNDILSLLNSPEAQNLPKDFKESLIKAAQKEAKEKQELLDKNKRLENELNNSRVVIDAVVVAVRQDINYFKGVYQSADINKILNYDYIELKNLIISSIFSLRKITPILNYSLNCALRMSKSEKIKPVDELKDKESQIQCAIAKRDDFFDEEEGIDKCPDITNNDRGTNLKKQIMHVALDIMHDLEHIDTSTYNELIKATTDSTKKASCSQNYVGNNKSLKDSFVKACNSDKELFVIQATKEHLHVMAQKELNSSSVKVNPKIEKTRVIQTLIPAKCADVIVVTQGVSDKDKDSNKLINPSFCLDVDVYSKGPNKEPYHERNSSDKMEMETNKDDLKAIFQDDFCNWKHPTEMKKAVHNLKDSKDCVQKEAKLSTSLVDYTTPTGHAVKVINPYAVDPNTTGHMPMYKKSKFSINIANALASSNVFDYTTKRRIIERLHQLGVNMSVSTGIDMINTFARSMLHGVGLQIREDILTLSDNIQMDECFIKVLDINREQSKDKSMLFAMRSGHTSPIKAVYHKASDNRGTETILEILRSIPKDSLAVKYLTTDALASYGAALKELSDEGIYITPTKCMQHAGRALFSYLNTCKLMDVYNKLLIKGDNNNKFPERLDAYMQKHPNTLNEKSRDLLLMFYLLRTLFIIEAEVAQKCNYNYSSDEYKQAITKARISRSKPIVMALFKIIHIHIIKYQNVDYKIKDGKTISYKPKKEFFESRALTYLLKLEIELKEFVNDSAIPISTNLCEQVHRLPITSHRCSEFLVSETGMHAFADYCSAINTCLLNNIAVSDYFFWLILNVKQRLIALKNKDHVFDDFMQRPRGKTVSVTQSDGSVVKKKINIYDKEYSCCYDKISYKGLTPYDYRRLVIEHGQVLA